MINALPIDVLRGFNPGRVLKFGALGVLFLFLCWQYVQATRIGYEVESIRREAGALRSQVAELRFKIDEIIAPSALAARASVQLGMFPASPAELRSLFGSSAAISGVFPRLRARPPLRGLLRI